MERKGFGVSDFEEIKIDYCQFIIVDGEKNNNALIYYVKKKKFATFFFFCLRE